ncbi:ArsR/SmtB family transcription factor [Flavobacterium psychrotrophum]|uniref:ArsR/SmtB family transcription factor n=1 Tax=Flavobacterium psychrotrophum TaxID=2294119 RepID=UPI0013C41EFA|nr:helix-turn-helix transcriptional regulator [Flavobacterium psychrotrophum]
MRHNLPLPVVTYNAPYMVMTFPRNTEALRKAIPNRGLDELTASELKGFEWLRTQDEISASQYAEHMGYSQRTANRHLSSFIERGLVTTNGDSNNSKNLKYIAVI